MIRRSAFKSLLAGLLWVALVFTPTFSMAQSPPEPLDDLTSGQVVLDNSGIIPFAPGFFAFEVESPNGSLKDVPIWNEIEAMLDDPYAFEAAPDVAGNAQGWPSYRSTHPRRRSFLPHGCTYEDPVPQGFVACDDSLLGRFLVHPLNYNHSTGQEMRLINPEFAGHLGFELPDELIQCGVGDPEEPAFCDEAIEVTSSAGVVVSSPAGDTNRYVWTYEEEVITSGAERFEEDEPAPDFNIPIGSDPTPLTDTCIVSTEATPMEGAIVCGGDPGEPGYLGFGVLGDLSVQYSTPGFPIPKATTDSPGSPADDLVALVLAGARLFDPARGYIKSLDEGGEGLEKPTLQNDDALGEEGEPNYLFNEFEAQVPSNENDYVRDRDAAIALGKALFWDMQVGSDSVQACASCHFHAGADNRTKNQLNPNHVNVVPDLSLEVFNNRTFPQDNNQDVVERDFPLHKLFDPLIVGDPACTTPLVVDGGVLGPVTACDASNIERTTNDVMSSMGVIFGVFDDILTPGGGRGSAAFLQMPGNAPRSLAPDLRSDTVDPIPLFQDLRRVEPRHTPTFIASAMNFDNFWDGRARHDFNGGSVFGAADPFHHVYACELNNAGKNCRGGPAGELAATRQIIRFSGLASLATGPVLSEFEMSFLGRNWPKMGKKLLQKGVVPLANQLVDPHDSALGAYSNQPGNSSPICGSNRQLNQRATGKPGLCISYNDLIESAFYPGLWVNKDQHLVGTAAPCTGTAGVGERTPAGCDGFDGYVLTIADGDLSETPDADMNGVVDGLEDTNKFTQMEANMALFFGLSVHIWGNVLIPDDSPMDQFFDANPDSFNTFGESGEPGIAIDHRNCFGEGGTDGVQPCFTPVGEFQRDPGVIARIGCTLEGGGDCTLTPSGGTRAPDDPDPLLGMDMFLGSNLSLKNPNFRSFRCGECHAGGTLTDHTFEISHQVGFGDRIQEFITGAPGSEIFPEALGRGRVISGFLLEAELGENAQDGVERNIADFELDVVGAPQGQALFDNGVYNIGVTPIGDDVSRGGDDPVAFPLSLSILALKNIGGIDYHPGGNDPGNGFAQPATPGIPMETFDPYAEADCIGITDPDVLAAMTACNTGGLFEENAQDEEINPGVAEEPENPLLPDHLAPWAQNIPVGDESNIDEVFFGINTLMREPMLEGFIDTLGPFNPAAIIGEVFNNADGPLMTAWPNVNRVNVQGAFKAPPLRFVELTAPFFHNGGKLTLRQVVDFYMRGGDFPISNAAHRDFLITHLNIEDEALGGVDRLNPARPPEFTEEEKEARRVALVDFLLSLTDERVRFQQAPFDQVELFVPLDGKAPDNGSLAGPVAGGRDGFLYNTVGDCGGVSGAGPCYLQVPATGAGGSPTPIVGFLGVEKGDRSDPNCNPGNGPISHYCAVIE
jgi:hypothetical protein